MNKIKYYKSIRLKKNYGIRREEIFANTCYIKPKRNPNFYVHTIHGWSMNSTLIVLKFKLYRKKI